MGSSMQEFTLSYSQRRFSKRPTKASSTNGSTFEFNVLTLEKLQPMSDSYLEIAEKTIKEVARPLHPKEMLEIASKSGIMHDHLHGKTQYKTLAARLSTEIRKRGKKSPFFRTAANQFFLWELNKNKYSEFEAPKREKTLHHENVLTIPDDYLRDKGAVGLISNISGLISDISHARNYQYLVRKDAEKCFDVKQFISYALIYRGGKILTYRRGVFSNAADELQGMRSIGFGGHVTDTDLNLFDTAGLGIIETARRELIEELLFERFELDYLDAPDRFKFLCGINTYETTEAKKHIAISVVYFCSNNFRPTKNELSINDLRWTSLSEPENNMDDFEPWSQTILKALYSGEISIDDN